MENIIIVLLFLSLVVNIPATIAYWIGLKFEVKDKNCSQEVKSVKQNILGTKIVQTINTVVMIALMILLNLM